MQIEGPLNIEIAEPADGQGKILVIAFKPDFQALSGAEQSAEFRSYLEALHRNITEVLPEGDANRAGMLVVQQVAEQLLPHIESGELALDETMTVQIRQADQVLALTDLLSDVPSGV